MRYILILALTIAGPAMAAEPLNHYGDMGTVITATTLDAASSTFVLKNNVAGRVGIYGLMVVYVTTVDADNGVSAVTMSCTGSRDQNTTDYTLQDCTTAAGVCTSSDASWVKNPGANTTRWAWRVDIEGFSDVQCTFTDTGGDASDTIAVEASVATKGG